MAGGVSLWSVTTLLGSYMNVRELECKIWLFSRGFLSEFLCVFDVQSAGGDWGSELQYDCSDHNKRPLRR